MRTAFKRVMNCAAFHWIIGDWFGVFIMSILPISIPIMWCVSKEFPESAKQWDEIL